MAADVARLNRLRPAPHPPKAGRYATRTRRNRTTMSPPAGTQ
jgi:hypothetical protein